MIESATKSKLTREGLIEREQVLFAALKKGFGEAHAHHVVTLYLQYREKVPFDGHRQYGLHSFAVFAEAYLAAYKLEPTLYELLSETDKEQYW